MVQADRHRASHDPLPDHFCHVQGFRSYTRRWIYPNHRVKWQVPRAFGWLPGFTTHHFHRKNGVRAAVEHREGVAAKMPQVVTSKSTRTRAPFWFWRIVIMYVSLHLNLQFTIYNLQFTIASVFLQLYFNYYILYSQMHKYIYIYIARERERERDRCDRQNLGITYPRHIPLFGTNSMNHENYGFWPWGSSLSTPGCLCQRTQWASRIWSAPWTSGRCGCYECGSLPCHPALGQEKSWARCWRHAEAGLWLEPVLIK